MFEDIVNRRMMKLKEYRTTIQTSLDELPIGRVRFTKNGTSTQVYLRVGDKEVYLRKNERDKIRPYAQRQYLEKVLAILDNEYCELKVLKEVLYENKVLELDNSLGEQRSNYITKAFLTDAELADRWSKEEYQVLQMNENEKKQDTHCGVMVRSKSERAIGNTLEEKGIPYRYECALKINNETIYPDFTIYIPQKRRVIYWEHFGRMNEEAYRKKAEEKIHKYMKAGLANVFLCTMEEEDKTIPQNIIDAMVEKYLL